MNPGHRLSSFAAASLLGTFIPAARSALTFDFDYSDPAAALLAPEARAALDTAGQRVASYFTNYTANVIITVTAYHDPLGAEWANAGTNWNLTGGSPGFNNPGVVGTKISSHGSVDQNGADPDGYININMGDWLTTTL